MKQINTYEYAVAFCNMAEKLMKQYEYIGDLKWGNPAEQTDRIPTYELITPEGKKVWCSIIEYVNAGTGIPNRRGILATFPVEKRQSLGSIMATMIPYEYKKTYNTRAYFEDNNYEIRNYGKITVGRAGIKKENFFEYMNENYSNIVYLDEVDNPYIKCYEYKNELTKKDFARQTYELTKLLSEFKSLYRK